MTTSVSIRPATPNDAEQLTDVAAQTFPLACPPNATEQDVAAFIAQNLSHERFVEYLNDPQRALLIAEHDGKACGYSMLVSGEIKDADVAAAVTIKPTVELSKIYVLLEHHGQGTAESLLTATLDRARKDGASGVWLGVNQLNVRAQRFYTKNGFTVVGEKKFHVGDQIHNDYVMEQPLT